MSVSAALAAIVRGEANNYLLPTCRLEWGGVEAYGQEAISEAFRAAPLDGDIHIIECADACVLSVDGCALFADLYNDHIGRLWRVGPIGSDEPEPFLSVPFDPDLHQQRGTIQFRLADHPSLDPRHAEPIVKAARDVLHSSNEEALHRARGFIIRAFSSEEQCGALVALYQLSGGQVRSSSWSYAVIFITPNCEPTTIVDQPLNRGWMPRL